MLNNNKVSHLLESTCPTCNSKLNAASSISGEDISPEPFDITVCYYCGEILEFAEDLLVKVITSTSKKSLPYEQLADITAVSNRLKKRKTMYH
jgi:hypothetical protein